MIFTISLALAAPPAICPECETHTVVVAAAPLEPGHQITEADIVGVNIPASYYVGAFADPEEVVGSIVQARMFPNDPVYPARLDGLIRAEASSLVPSGMVGLAIASPTPPLIDMSRIDLVRGDCFIAEVVPVLVRGEVTLLIVTPEQVPKVLASPYTLGARAIDDLATHPERACP